MIEINRIISPFDERNKIVGEYNRIHGQFLIGKFNLTRFLFDLLKYRTPYLRANIKLFFDIRIGRVRITIDERQ